MLFRSLADMKNGTDSITQKPVENEKSADTDIEGKTISDVTGTEKTDIGTETEKTDTGTGTEKTDTGTETEKTDDKTKGGK